METISNLTELDIPAANSEPDLSPDPVAAIDATCWAFSGIVGGAGVTSLCIQTAFERAQKQRLLTPAIERRATPRVCLIDLDFENGTCAHYLDLKPGLHLSDLQGDPSRMDPDLINALSTVHKCGLSLLATPNSLDGNSQANPDTVLAMLDTASHMYDYIILDVPRLWQPWTHAAFMAAHRLALVMELNIPSLHLTRSKLEAIEESVKPTASVDIILNKYEKRAFRNSLRVNDAEQTIGRKIFSTISLDTDVVREAINWGIPAGTARSDSRYAKDCRVLTERWDEENSIQKVA